MAGCSTLTAKWQVPGAQAATWILGVLPYEISSISQQDMLETDLDIDLFRDRQGVLNFDAEVSNGTLELGMAEKELNCTDVACAAVDQRCLRPAQRMGPVRRRIQSDR